MGEVYRARDPKLDRNIALKILSSDLASSNEHLRRFEYEARAASALNHPNIITIYDVGRDGDFAYIAMELIEGRDLRDMTADGAMPLKHVLRVSAKLADGLAAAHERGIVHRDLKPENVIVSNDGFVKVLDFGLAKLVRQINQDDKTLPHTVPGAVFGTVGYMSPEQASGKTTDFRSDQFAIGVIIYELLTRRRPFDEPTAAETMAAIIRNDPKPLREIRPDVPRDLDRIVTRCLSKDAHDRYASTRDLARDLREVRNMITAPSGAERTSTARPRYIPRLKKRLWPALIVAAAVIIGVIAGAAFFRGKPSATTIRALGVLPFRDLSGVPEGQHFADGIAETIAARLSQSNTIRVASIPSANGSPKEIAAKIGADRLLKGSVQRSGDQVRLTYAIVDPASGDEAAGDTLTENIADVFALEDRAADKILEALRVAHDRVPHHMASTGLTRAADQATYLEAVGLLSTAKDQKSIQQAIDKLDSILANARDSATLNAQLSRAILLKYSWTRQRNLIADAQLYADRAVQFDSQSPDAQLALGNARLTIGKAPEGIESLKRAIALRPNFAEAYVSLGSAQEMAGRAADAEHSYQKAIELRPDMPSAYLKYGTYCLNRGRYADAVRYYRRVIELVPDGARGYSSLGAALQELGQSDEAIAAYQQAMALEPTAASYSNLGTIEFFRGHYDEAARAFEKASTLSPNRYAIWINLGDAYRWSNRQPDAMRAYERAIAEARAALAINAKDAVARATIASCLARTGRHQEAEAEIRNAVAVDATNSNVLYAAAVVCQLRGDSDAALEWLRRAVQNGFSRTDAAADPDLRALRERTEFKTIINRST